MKEFQKKGNIKIFVIRCELNRKKISLGDESERLGAAVYLFFPGAR
jgi:hypothetical protein